ncbi:hypothetical protein Hanom_Chr12g01075241 [Helianthus anomalus]
MNFLPGSNQAPRTAHSLPDANGKFRRVADARKPPPPHLDQRRVTKRYRRHMTHSKFHQKNIQSPNLTS